jgi:hypothetical protein
LSDTKRKRRPGGGRKPIDPQGVIAPVRFTSDDWKAITAAGKRFNFKRSHLIRVAVRGWLGMVQYPEPHVVALSFLITRLIKTIEERSGRKWIADPETAAAIREEIGVLINGLAPEAKKGLVLSSELRHVARDLMVILAHLSLQPQPSSLADLGDDWAALALITKDLGPALLRRANKAVVTITEIEGRQRR